VTRKLSQFLVSRRPRANNEYKLTDVEQREVNEKKQN
jgi:hypothetical protein